MKFRIPDDSHRTRSVCDFVYIWINFIAFVFSLLLPQPNKEANREKTAPKIQLTIPIEDEYMRHMQQSLSHPHQKVSQTQSHTYAQPLLTLKKAENEIISMDFMCESLSYGVSSYERIETIFKWDDEKWKRRQQSERKDRMKRRKKKLFHKCFDRKRHTISHQTQRDNQKDFQRFYLTCTLNILKKWLLWHVNEKLWWLTLKLFQQ